MHEFALERGDHFLLRRLARVSESVRRTSPPLTLAGGWGGGSNGHVGHLALHLPPLCDVKCQRAASRRSQASLRPDARARAICHVPPPQSRVCLASSRLRSQDGVDSCRSNAQRFASDLRRNEKMSRNGPDSCAPRTDAPALCVGGAFSGSTNGSIPSGHRS